MINLLPERLRPGIPRAIHSWAMFGAILVSLIGGSIIGFVGILAVVGLSPDSSPDSLVPFSGRWIPLLTLITEGSIFLCVVGGALLLRLDLRRTLRLNPALPWGAAIRHGARKSQPPPGGSEPAGSGAEGPDSPFVRPLGRIRVWGASGLVYSFALGGVLATGMASDFVLQWLRRLAPGLNFGFLEAINQMASYSGPVSFLGVVFAMAFLPGVCEEIAFRGFIQKGFERSYRPGAAIFWASVLFGLIHGDPLQAIGTMLLGFFLGFVAYRTDSLYPCAVAHFANNVGAIYVANLHPGDLEATLGGEPSLPRFFLGLLVGGLCILGLLWITRPRRRSEGTR